MNHDKPVEPVFYRPPEYTLVWREGADLINALRWIALVLSAICGVLVAIAANLCLN